MKFRNSMQSNDGKKREKLNWKKKVCDWILNVGGRVTLHLNVSQRKECKKGHQVTWNELESNQTSEWIKWM